MAKYNPTTSEFVVNGWGSSFTPMGKHPIIANRIWNTLADAQKFVDTNDTAIAGLTLSVINDIDEKNGIYFVEYVKGDMPEDLQHGKLSRVGSGEGTKVVATKKEAEALATDENIGLIVLVKENNTTYIVAGSGNLIEFGIATDAGKLAKDVEALKESDKKNIKTITIGGVEHKVTSEDGKGVATAHTFDTDVTGTTNSLNAPTTRAVEEAYKKLNDLISPIPRFEIVVASKLPEPATKEHLAKVYLIPSDPASKETKDMYTEYVCVEKKSEQTTYSWEKLGAASVDLANYVKTSDFTPVKNDVTSIKSSLGTYATEGAETALNNAVNDHKTYETVTSNAAAGKKAADSLGSKYAEPNSAETALNDAVADHTTLGTIKSSLGTYATEGAETALNDAVADHAKLSDYDTTVKPHANAAFAALGTEYQGADAVKNKFTTVDDALGKKLEASALNDYATKAVAIGTVSIANGTRNNDTYNVDLSSDNVATSNAQTVTLNLSMATKTLSGMMSGTDKTKLDEITALSNDEIDTAIKEADQAGK